MERKKPSYNLQLDLSTRYGRIMAWVVGTILYLTFLRGAAQSMGNWAVWAVIAVTAMVLYRPVRIWLSGRFPPKEGPEP